MLRVDISTRSRDCILSCNEYRASSVSFPQVNLDFQCERLSRIIGLILKKVALGFDIFLKYDMDGKARGLLWPCKYKCLTILNNTD